MNVYFLRLTENVDTQLTNKEYIVGSRVKLLGDVAVGDYIFVQSSKDRFSNKSSIKRLWKVVSISGIPNAKASCEETLFNELTIEDFISLNLFKLNSGLVVFSGRQGGGLHKLELDKPSEFYKLISSIDDLNEYLSNKNSYRAIKLMKSRADCVADSQDIQLFFEGELVHYYPASFYSDEFVSKFDPNGMSEAKPALNKNGELRKNDCGKMISFLSGNKDVVPTILGLWDLFNSDVDHSNDFNTWIVPCDLESYDFEKDIEDNGYVYWHIVKKDGTFFHYAKGDIVYVYFSGKRKTINYKMVVEEPKLAASEISREKTYWKKDEAPTSSFYAKFNFVEKIDEGISISELKSLNFSSNINGQQTISSKKVKEFLDSKFTKKIAKTPVDDVVVSNNLCKPEFTIYYGIPGCGKSYKLNEYLLKAGYKENQDDENFVIRTVFYPDYTNSDFIGQYVPTKTSGGIQFDVKVGPFVKALGIALNNPNKMVALVIEEINRGNAAAIFGDVFQLLDRDLTTFESAYSIENPIITEALSEKFDQSGIVKIRIPKNLSIFATMNTSDQNVFKLDSAFKRRWNQVRIVNDLAAAASNDFEIPNLNVTWLEFVKQVNKHILESGQEEDRQLGCWFFNKLSDGVSAEAFANKVLEYLWNDVCKYNNILFDESIKSFDDLYHRYMNKQKIFSFDFE